MRALRNCSFILLAVVALQLSACRVWAWRYGADDHLRMAEELMRQEKFDDAIKHYHSHITERLEIKDRPDWENPHFYMLMIGDILLMQGRDKEALDAYMSAETQGVESQLVADRYRYLGRWYEKNGRYREGIEVLSRFKDRDPLLFDVILDRMSRELVIREDSGVPGDEEQLDTHTPAPDATP